MKRCSRCRNDMPLESFSKGSREKDGLAEWCKSCASAYQKAYRKSKPGYRKDYAANWRALNREIFRAAVLHWQQQNREKSRAISRRYGKENRARCNAIGAARRGRMLRATPAWADSRAMAAFYSTADALGMLTGQWHHVDHIVPLVSKRVCGLHCQSNLQVLTDFENLSKGNRAWPNMFEELK